MALKAITDSRDSVEEQVRSLYEQKDGKFVLMVDGIELHPGAAALKAALDRIRGEKRTISDKLTAAESRLEGLPADFDIEAYETFRQQAEGNEPPKIEERLAAQKTQLEAKFAKDREKLEARANKLDGTLRRVMVDDVGYAEATGEGGPMKLVEIDSSASAGNGEGVETVWYRRHWLMHPRGIAYFGTPASACGVIDAELATGAN